jgi:hypothetical protein
MAERRRSMPSLEEMQKEGVNMDDLLDAWDIGDPANKWLSARESRIYRTAKKRAFPAGLAEGLGIG